MPIQRDGTLTFTARFVMHFVMACASVEEARRSLPDLTEQQFAALRSGKARLTGDSKAGLNYLERVG